jgi:Flp pilus assembly pilin Flp
MPKLTVWLRSKSRREEGQDLVEYAMLFSLIAIIVLVAVTFFGEEVSQTLSNIGTIVQGWTAGG